MFPRRRAVTRVREHARARACVRVPYRKYAPREVRRSKVDFNDGGVGRLRARRVQSDGEERSGSRRIKPAHEYLIKYPDGKSRFSNDIATIVRSARVDLSRSPIPRLERKSAITRNSGANEATTDVKINRSIMRMRTACRTLRTPHTRETRLRTLTSTRLTFRFLRANLAVSISDSQKYRASRLSSGEVHDLFKAFKSRSLINRAVRRGAICISSEISGASTRPLWVVRARACVCM